MESNVDKPFGIRIRHRLEYMVVRVIICLIQIFPIEYCAVLAKWFGMFAHDWLRIRRKIVESNLRIVFPNASQKQLDRIGRSMWEHLILMICEIAHAPRMIHEGTWRKHVLIRDKRVLTKYFLDGRPLVMVSGHFGNFEIASYITGVLGIPTFTMGKPIGNPHIDRFVRHFRQFRGQYLLPFNNSTPIIEKVLNGNGILTLLGDQHAGNRGCWVDFFGKQASCHKALALFTLTQQAPMLVNYAARLGRPMTFEIGCVGVADPHELTDEQMSVKGLTQWYNRKLEGIVRAMPSQYWWLHKRWKEKPARNKVRRTPLEQEAATASVERAA